MIDGRVTAVLGMNKSVTVAGPLVTLDDAIALLEECLAKVWQGRMRGISLSTFVRLRTRRLPHTPRDASGGSELPFSWMTFFLVEITMWPFLRKPVATLRGQRDLATPLVQLSANDLFDNR
ncbi:MAG: hypothetical protein NT013_15260 [Planctomycetia bacterium]|nr:hypothetical protein [Planctomycetia bacterium]